MQKKNHLYNSYTIKYCFGIYQINFGNNTILPLKDTHTCLVVLYAGKLLAVRLKRLTERQKRDWSIDFVEANKTTNLDSDYRICYGEVCEILNLSMLQKQIGIVSYETKKKVINNLKNNINF